MTDKIKITRRSKNLGYGWTTEPVSGSSTPRIQDVKRPNVTGTLRAIEAEYRRRANITSGGVWYRDALYVGGRRVVNETVRNVLAELDTFGSCTVEVE